MDYVPRDYLSVQEIAAELHTNDSRILEYASRVDDPIPLVHPPWCSRRTLVKRDDLIAWMDRNCAPYRKQKGGVMQREAIPTSRASA